MSNRSGAIRNATVIATAALAILLAGRSAIGRAPPDHPLAAFHMVAVGHPRPATERVMLAAAKAAEASRPLDESAMVTVRSIARHQPLSPVPFLIEGARAELAGQLDLAVRRYEAARRRDPRSGPTRLVLAQAYARQGDAVGSILELEAATRLQPGSRLTVVPAIAEMAKHPHGEAIISKLLEERPQIRSLVLQSLASDISNIALLLRLAQSAGSDPEEQNWKNIAVNALVADGQIARARRLWAAWNNHDPRVPLTDPTFAGGAVEPFGWAILSDPAGVATRAEGGGLEVVFFGRDQATFARQLVTLVPGRYALSTSYEGGPPGDQVFWNLRCRQGQALTQVQLSQLGLFEVPPGCDAQWLELVAIPPAEPQTVELTVRAVKLERVPN